MAIDLTSPKQAGELLRAHGLRPVKRLGQNFLCDRNTLDRIVRVADIAPGDPVLEIGAGLGALTLALASRAARVTSVEIDRQLEPLLREAASTAPNVSLVFEDFLRLNLAQLLDQAFGTEQGVVAANIPYYITSPIVERLLEQKQRIKRIVLLVQQEFAARATAPAGSDECGSMSLFLQYHAQVEIAGIVPRTVFLPVPDVSSAILVMTPVAPGTVSVQNEDRMLHLIRAGFGQRRKTLLNALMRAPASFNLGFGMEDREKIERLLERAGIDGRRRGETLTLEEYARLADTPVE